VLRPRYWALTSRSATHQDLNPSFRTHHPGCELPKGERAVPRDAWLRRCLWRCFQRSSFNPPTLPVGPAMLAVGSPSMKPRGRIGAGDSAATSLVDGGFPGRHRRRRTNPAPVPWEFEQQTETSWSCLQLSGPGRVESPVTPVSSAAFSHQPSDPGGTGRSAVPRSAGHPPYMAGLGSRSRSIGQGAGQRLHFGQSFSSSRTWFRGPLDRHEGVLPTRFGACGKECRSGLRGMLATARGRRCGPAAPISSTGKCGGCNKIRDRASRFRPKLIMCVDTAAASG
jgi:hypothetical protein